MKYFAFILISLFFSELCSAQESVNHADLNRRQWRQLLSSEESPAAARSYAEKHIKTRRVANGFLIGSGAIALSGVVFNYTNNYEEGTWDELGHGLALTGFMWGTGISLVTSGILHLIANEQFLKGKEIYLDHKINRSGDQVEFGIRIRF